MPISPEQAIALSDTENKQLHELYEKIDLQLAREYDYDVEVEVNLPVLRRSVVKLLTTTYEALGWSIYSDDDDENGETLTFSSNLTSEYIPYNKPSGSPYR